MCIRDRSYIYTVINNQRHIVTLGNGVYLLGKFDILPCASVFLTELKKGYTAFQSLLHTAEKFFLGVVRAVSDKI